MATKFFKSSIGAIRQGIAFTGFTPYSFTMKRTARFATYFILAFVLLMISYSGKTAPLYGQQILVSAIDDGPYNQSVNDLKNYLAKITGKDFRLSNYKSKEDEGIYILLNAPGLLSADLNKKLQNGTIEDFVISGNEKQLLLVATHPKGLSLAIYTYLDKLGAKWYFPGDDWTYVPSLSQITIKNTQYYTPSFHLRNFFGTGGIVPEKTIDPSSALQQDWDNWKRRNRMGGELDLPGHYGDIFNLNHRAELEQHPEYLAMVGGKRGPWSTTVKWCISNKDLRALFVNDRVAFLKNALNTQKYANAKIAIPVDPADGYGDCECDQCKKLGSVSDRDFLLANEVAQAVAKISPVAYPNLYGYNAHAAAPSFKLEPNVIVQIIPYAFQNVGTPVQMITAWKQQSNNVYLYDYYGIPDWHFDTPLSGGWSPDGLVNKMKDWQKFNIKGFLLESAYSIGSAGMGLYLMGRLGWNVNEGVSGIRTAFYKNMFGTATPQLKAYFERVNGNFAGAADLPYLLDLLQKADAATQSAAVKNRIQKFQLYLHYLVLYYQWQSATADKKNEAWENVVKYVWQIYPTAMVHSTRIAELMNAHPTANAALVSKWNVYNPGDGVKQIKFIGSNEVSALSKTDMKKYPVLAGFNYTKSPAALNYVVQPASTPDEANPAGMLISDFPETYVQPGSDGYFRMMLKVNEASANNLQQTNVIHCTDVATGKEVFTQKVDIDKNWKTLSMKLPAGKRYRLIIDHSNWIRIYIPQNQWAAFKTIPTYAVMGKLWFYMPPGTQYLYYSNTNAEQPAFVDEAGKPVNPEKVNDQNMYRLTASSPSSGKWWAIAASEYKGLQFYSMPDLFFPHPNYSVKSR